MGSLSDATLDDHAGIGIPQLRNRALPRGIDIREWYVCTRGSEPVGPVSSELVARGIVAGKVPRDALLARVGDSVWQRVLRVPEITAALEAIAPRS
jgi:hypothetical protein